MKAFLFLAVLCSKHIVKFVILLLSIGAVSIYNHALFWCEAGGDVNSYQNSSIGKAPICMK